LVTSAAIEQLLIKGEEEQVYDLIRDIVMAHHSVIRGMRSQARSLEEISLGNVGAAREVNRVDKSSTHHTGGAAAIR
jgi:hypothetical protein